MSKLTVLMIALLAIALNLAICAGIGYVVYIVLVLAGVAAPWPAVSALGVALVMLMK